MSSNLCSCTRLLLCALVSVGVSLLAGCGTIIEPWGPTTSVTPLATEDVKQACRFEMQFPAPDVPQAGVLVIYERGDSAKLYEDATVQAAAAKLHFATVFAYECDANSFHDLQYDAAKGPGRALFQALNQFATFTSHPEVANANVVVSGFSAAGYLSFTMANDFPDRVLGAVLFEPASAYADIENEPITAKGAQVPMLILASGGDLAAGTHRPLALFQRGWGQGARWGFGIQKDAGHCCTDSVASLQNAWLTGLIQSNTAAPATSSLVASVPQSTPVVPTVQFNCIPNSAFDVFGWQSCTMGEASILPSTLTGLQPAWLPDAGSAKVWLTWVTNTKTN